MENPSLKRRLVASTIDGAVTLSMIAFFLFLAHLIDDDSPVLRIIALVLGILYEPVMTVYFQTGGKWFAGIRVVNYHTGKKINLLDSLLRFAFKVMLGWKSFLFYDHSAPRAVHDTISGTEVVMNT